MAIGGVKERAVKSLASMAGIDLDASLPELIESLNDSFDLGLDVRTPVDVREVAAAVMGVARLAAEPTPERRFFVISAAPEGKPPVRAFVVVG